MKLVKSSTKLNLVLTALLVFLASSSASAQTPEATLYSVFSKLTSSKDVSPLVEIVDWDGLYSKMPEVQKEQEKFKGPEDLKNYYKERATNNGSDSVKMLEGSLTDKGLSSSEKKISKETLNKAGKHLEGIRSKTKRQLAKTKFIIEHVKLETDDQATISLKKIYEDKESMLTMSMYKTERGWVTEDAGALNPLGSGGSPIGAFPEPLSALSRR